MITTKEQREEIERILNKHQRSIDRNNMAENHKAAIYAMMDVLDILDIEYAVAESDDGRELYEVRG